MEIPGFLPGCRWIKEIKEWLFCKRPESAPKPVTSAWKRWGKMWRVGNGGGRRREIKKVKHGAPPVLNSGQIEVDPLVLSGYVQLGSFTLLLLYTRPWNVAPITRPHSKGKNLADKSLSLVGDGAQKWVLLLVSRFRVTRFPWPQPWWFTAHPLCLFRASLNSLTSVITFKKAFTLTQIALNVALNFANITNLFPFPRSWIAYTYYTFSLAWVQIIKNWVLNKSNHIHKGTNYL